MPTLSNHQSNSYVKLLVEGDSKSGKSGALASLVEAGYFLRILDYDNGLDVLRQFVARDCPEGLDRVEYRTLRDKRKATAGGPAIDGTPKAFVDGIKMLDRWKYEETDLGIPAEWGPDCIFVLDSLTFFGDAAYEWREPLTPRSRDGKYDKRAVYGDAQDAVEQAIALLTSESFRTNVIVISHIKYVDNPDGTKKGYPSAVGSALSPLILRYFNNVVRFTNIGGKRKIETVSSPMFDLANSAPFKMEKTYDIENGLAEFFAVLRDPPNKGEHPKPELQHNDLKPSLKAIAKIRKL
jgi:AAA domain